MSVHIRLSDAERMERIGARPAGYVADLRRYGRVRGPDLVLSVDAYLSLCRAYQTPPTPPGPIQRARNLGAAMVDWAAGGFRVVDDVELARRLAVCMDGCRYWDPAAWAGTGGCIHQACGCTLAKLRLATSRCPIGRW